MKKAFALVAALFTATPAAAQQPVGHLPFYSCGPTEVMVNGLKKEYGEDPIFLGVASDTHLDRVFLDAADGSYSVLRSNAQGVSCIILSGQGGQTLEIKAPGEGA